MDSTGGSGGDGDPISFVQGYDDGDLEIAAEFLTTWLPFLSSGLCSDCAASLHDRILSLRSGPPPSLQLQSPPPPPSDIIVPTGWDSDAPAMPGKPRMSWADMAQEDELAAAEEEEAAAATAEAAAEEEEEEEEEEKPARALSRAQREQIRFGNVVRRKDFRCYERVDGRLVNILAGLELHAGVFSAAEQRRIVDFVYALMEKGRKGELGDRTYTEPQKWMRGKGRVTIQFGCCYNYATDKDGNPPGILRKVVADPVPDLFKVMIKRLVRWHVLPMLCVPDSCIVNIYEPGDCIPPHIDSHDFVRPFCTVSFLSECNILFGSNLKVAGPGEFTGSVAIPLPVGSVLVLNGNGADVAKHCVPAVPTKRISITFRKMDETKRPFSFREEPDLQNIIPFPETTVPEATASPEEGKGKQPGVQIRNVSKSHRGKRSKGRTPARGGQGILGSQPPRRDAHTPTNENSPVHSLDRQSGMPSVSAERERDSVGRLRLDGRPGISTASAERERDFTGRSRESKYRQEPQDMQSTEFYMDEAGELPNRLAKGRRRLEGVGTVEDSAETVERRVRMDQRQMVIINRTINDDMEALSIGNHDPAKHPRVSIRTLYNNRQRRSRVSLSDD